VAGWPGWPWITLVVPLKSVTSDHYSQSPLFSAVDSPAPSNCILTVAADVLLYTLIGKLAITILCSLMLPKMYVFWFIGRRGKAGVFCLISAS
jgi:hypothetical protein